MKMKNLLFRNGIFELIIYLVDMYWFSHSHFVYFVCASMLFFCVASFPTPSAFLVAPSYTTSPVLKKTLSFETFIRPLCASFELRCFAMLHRFLRPPHSSLLRLTPRRLSWKRRSHLTLSFALCVLRLCSDVVFLCCIVSYALRIPRCSVLHHVACLAKHALIWHSYLPFGYFVCAPMLFLCVASFPTPAAFLVAPSCTTSPVFASKRRSHLTLSFALSILSCASMCFCVASVSYTLYIPRCSVLHHVAHLAWQSSRSKF